MIKKPLPLSIQKVFKAYDSFMAVKGVCFDIHEGEVFGLLGPNGAGKTSIISMINTVEGITSGTITVFGEKVEENKLIKSKIGCVPQELINYGFFTLEEILQIHSGYYGILKNNAKIDYLIERLHLGPYRDKKAKLLSSGIKKRLMIANAFLHEPKLVLLDEPTAGVDVSLKMTLWDFIKEEQRKGVAFLLTTHYLEEAEKLCDRVGILEQGKLKAVGDPKDLIKQKTFRYFIITLKEAKAPLKHPNLIAQQGTSLTFKLHSSEALGDLLRDIKLESSQIEDIHVKEGTLEDVFNSILGEHYA